MEDMQSILSNLIPKNEPPAPYKQLATEILNLELTMIRESSRMPDKETLQNLILLKELAK